MRTFVFQSFRHAPFSLAGKTLRGHLFLELTEKEVASLTPEEREAVKVGKARHEIAVHPMSNGRPVEPNRSVVVEAKGISDRDNGAGS